MVEAQAKINTINASQTYEIYPRKSYLNRVNTPEGLSPTLHYITIYDASPLATGFSYEKGSPYSD